MIFTMPGAVPRRINAGPIQRIAPIWETTTRQQGKGSKLNTAFTAETIPAATLSGPVSLFGNSTYKIVPLTIHIWVSATP